DHIIKMENPSEKLQIEAITQNPVLITYSSTAWGDTARTMAFDANHDNFKYLKNPTDEQCKKALTYKPEQIVYIENPAEEYQIFAIAIRPALIVLGSIEWSETCQRMAFEADYDNFKYLKTPTVEECWAA